ncbi:DUF6875 domain-containing protein [Nonomuraea soli]|uniref:DUF6875 domain-containing protein n=1 Tax=Nonomuraea soli TaxID=1032476 RepID=A0A7W0CL16_9ACTN|nr:hypothetical protein [Nonomuraea soli]MBA2892922.1 hypothetical protein [Nonomuraea soli]
MIIHPDDPALRLVEVGTLEELAEPYRDAAARVAAWAREFLCRPHPELGRRGPVCPYAQGSIDRGRFYLAVRPGVPSSAAEVVRALEPYRAWFADLAPREKPDSLHTAVLVLFPDAGDRLDLIDGAQQELKDAYVPDGLMIGEFHPGPPDKGGLWNPDLRPLAAPVPMLVIRHMVATDLPFLAGDAAHLRAYRRLHGEAGQRRVPEHLREAVAER